MVIDKKLKQTETETETEIETRKKRKKEEKKKQQKNEKKKKQKKRGNIRYSVFGNRINLKSKVREQQQLEKPVRLTFKHQ